MVKEPKSKQDYHLGEIDRGVDKLNVWFIVNTIATILTGLAAVFLAILGLLK